MRLIIHYKDDDQLEHLEVERYSPPAPNWPYLALWLTDQFSLVNMDVIHSFSVEGGEEDRSISQNSVSSMSR